MVENNLESGMLGVAEDGRVVVYNSRLGYFLVGNGLPDEKIEERQAEVWGYIYPADVIPSLECTGWRRLAEKHTYRTRKLHWACPLHLRPGRDMTPARKRGM